MSSAASNFLRLRLLVLFTCCLQLQCPASWGHSSQGKSAWKIGWVSGKCQFLQKKKKRFKKSNKPKRVLKSSLGNGEGGNVEIGEEEDNPNKSEAPSSCSEGKESYSKKKKKKKKNHKEGKTGRKIVVLFFPTAIFNRRFTC